MKTTIDDNHIAWVVNSCSRKYRVHQYILNCSSNYDAIPLPKDFTNERLDSKIRGLEGELLMMISPLPSPIFPS